MRLAAFVSRLVHTFSYRRFKVNRLYFQIYTLAQPFPELNDAQVVAKVLKGYRPRKPSPETGMQLYVWSLARRCWAVKASRPDIAAVIDSLANQRIIPLTVRPRSPPPSPSKRTHHHHRHHHHHHTSTPSNSTLSELADLATSDSDGHSLSLSGSSPSANTSPFFPPSIDPSPISPDFRVYHQTQSRTRSISPRDLSPPPPRPGIPHTFGSHAVLGYPIITPQASPAMSSEEFDKLSPRSSLEDTESNVFYPVVL